VLACARTRGGYGLGASMSKTSLRTLARTLGSQPRTMVLSCGDLASVWTFVAGCQHRSEDGNLRLAGAKKQKASSICSVCGHSEPQFCRGVVCPGIVRGIAIGGQGEAMMQSPKWRMTRAQTKGLTPGSG
jgi:hypothetical protein